MTDAVERAGRWEGHLPQEAGASPPVRSASCSLNDAGAIVKVEVGDVELAVGMVFRDVDEHWLVRYGDRRRLRVFRFNRYADGRVVAWTTDLNCRGVSPFFPVENLADPAKFERCPELEGR